MKTSSAKNKGRRACQEAKEELLKFLPVDPDDIVVTSSGAGGKDLKFSPKARGHFPFVVEVKNQEAVNIWQAYAQAEEHWQKEISREEVYPVLIYKRNRSDLMISMSLEDFLHFTYRRGKHAEPVQKSKPEETHDAIGGVHIP
jgi:hypothetical protein